MAGISKKRSVIALSLHNSGMDNSEIANQLRIKQSTVERYIRHARYKKENHRGNQARILLLDVETAPLELYGWSLRQKFFHTEAIKREWFILSWAAKYLFEPHEFGYVVEPDEAKENDDSRILQKLWQEMDKADIIIAHNAINFDIRKINSRFFEHGFIPTSPYQVIDTYKISRRLFAHTSQRLEYLTKHFKLSEKLKTEFSLWPLCIEGNQKALDYMFRYNKQDIFALEDYYLKLRPWIPSHPNIFLYSDMNQTICPRCGARSVFLEEHGQYVTPAGSFIAIRCNACGGFSRSRKSIITGKERDNMLVPIAR